MRGLGHGRWASVLVLFVLVVFASGCSGDDETGGSRDIGENLDAIALFQPAVARFAIAGERFTDKTGLISVEVPERWSDREEGEWRTKDDTLIGWRLLASPDIDGFNSGWDTPGLVVLASPLVGQHIAAGSTQAALSDLYAAISPGEALAKECNPQAQEWQIEAGKDDPFSQALGDITSSGFAKRYSACGGGEATFTDLVLLTKENVFAYVVVATATPADQADTDQALTTLELKYSTGGPAPEPGKAEKQAISPDASIDDLVKLIPQNVGDAELVKEPEPNSEVATNIGARAAIAAFYSYEDSTSVEHHLMGYESLDKASARLKDIQTNASQYGLKFIEEGTVVAGVQQVGVWQLYEWSEGGKTGGFLNATNGPYVIEVITPSTELAKGFYQQLPY